MPTNATGGTFDLPAYGGKRYTASGVVGALRRITHVWAHGGIEMEHRQGLRYTKKDANFQLTSRANPSWDGTTAKIVTPRGAVGRVALHFESLEGATGVEVNVGTLTRSGGSETIVNTVTKTNTSDFWDTVGWPVRVLYARYKQIRQLATAATGNAGYCISLGNGGPYGAHDQDVFAKWNRTPTQPAPDSYGFRKPLGWTDGYVAGPMPLPVGFADRPVAYKYLPDGLVWKECFREVGGSNTYGRFDIPAMSQQEVWIEVFAGKNIVAGTYTGNITVTVGGVLERTIPLQVTVRTTQVSDVPAVTLNPLVEYTHNVHYTKCRYLEPYSTTDITGAAVTGPQMAAHRTLMNQVYDRTLKMLHEHYMGEWADYYSPEDGRFYDTERYPVGGSTNAGLTEIPRAYAKNFVDGATVGGLPTRFSVANGYEGPGLNTGNRGIYSIGTYGNWTRFAGGAGQGELSFIHQATRSTNCCVAMTHDWAGGTRTITGASGAWSALNGSRTFTAVSGTVTAATQSSPCIATLAGLAAHLPDRAKITLSGFTGTWTNINRDVYVKRVGTTNTYELYGDRGLEYPIYTGDSGAMTGSPVFTSTNAFFLGVDTSGYAADYTTTDRMVYIWRSGSGPNEATFTTNLAALESWFGSNAPYVRRMVYISDEVGNYDANAPQCRWTADMIARCRPNTNIKSYATMPIAWAHWGDVWPGYKSYGYEIRNVEIVGEGVWDAVLTAGGSYTTTAAIAAHTAAGRLIQYYNGGNPFGNYNLEDRGAAAAINPIAVVKQGCDPFIFVYLGNSYWNYSNFPWLGTIRKWVTRRIIASMTSIGGGKTRVTTTEATRYPYTVGMAMRFDSVAGTGWTALNSGTFNVSAVGSSTQFDIDFDSSALSAFVANGYAACGPYLADPPFVDANTPGAFLDVWASPFSFGQTLRSPDGYTSDDEARLTTGGYLTLMGPDAGTTSTSASNQIETLWLYGKDMLFNNPLCPGVDGPIPTRRLKNHAKGALIATLYNQAKAVNSTTANAVIDTLLTATMSTYTGRLNYGGGPAPYTEDDAAYTNAVVNLCNIIEGV